MVNLAPLVYVAIAAVLYYVGGRGYADRGTQQGLRTAASSPAWLTIVIALDSPIDTYADQLFWVHMLQHVLLLTVAPPLILLGRPWPRMWRALPLRRADQLGRTLVSSRLDGSDPRARAPVAGLDAVQRRRSSPGTSRPPTT